MTPNMPTQTEILNYEEEYNTLKDSSEWFKPIQGYYELTLMSELSKPVKKMSTFKDQNGMPQEVEQSEIIVKHQGKLMKWSVTKGTSKQGVYAKLLFLGKAWKSLKDRVIHLTVEGQGKGKKITIQEYAQLISQMNPQPAL